jgi:hypothetical protein
MGGKLGARLIGVEFYFDDLKKGKQFYGKTLDLDLLDEVEGHHARFSGGAAFLCLERKGSETYPSRDKAVIFLEVPNLTAAVDRIGKEKFVQVNLQGENERRPWAVMHDPERYNVVFVEASTGLKKDGE